jgi:isoleucyl-tRNA synthetase
MSSQPQKVREQVGERAMDPAAPKGEKRKYPVNLPRTDFPMKANLVQNEPASVKRWQSAGIYRRLREQRAGAPTWVFHDGPPYANGGIHLGHLMNKCLKDIVVRSRSMQGLNVPYVPGWDCHGLPIEHKVVSELVGRGRHERLAALDHWERAVAIRRECQRHAEKYVRLQSSQMQRLLTIGDYENPYLTMQPEYEGAVLDVLADLLERGLVYRALKPVHWSIENETALAEAELEYQEREDPSVYVEFEASDREAVFRAFDLPAGDVEEEDLEGTGDRSTEAVQPNRGEDQDPVAVPKPGVRPLVTPTFLIWTTTPWTLPANLAIAVNPKFEYALVWMDGSVAVVAAEAVERVVKAGSVDRHVVIAKTTGHRLLGLRYRHPFVTTRGGEAVHTVVGADYVTLDDGTGLVHTAPGHGEEDYLTGMRMGLPIYCPVKGNGRFDDSAPEWLRGLLIWEANHLIIQHLEESGHLFAKGTVRHSYPHDWRSKTPVILRTTEQWFVAVERPFSVEGDPARSLKERALAAIETSVRFVPEWGRNRMRGMLESRPDWCISRQRAWGLPIPAFVLPDGTVFMTARSCRAVAEVVRAKGADAWFTLPAARLLEHYDAFGDPDAPASLRNDPSLVARLEKGRDILDVWFESGSSWNAVMRRRGLGYPAELYLEGSDQHRGWFQLSLLPALGVTGRPPFRTILTHGFMVDRDGKKLSKSRPDAARYEVDSLCAEFGMDVMRWWVCSLAYENDIKADLELFALAGESYRKVRNTLRYMLGNLGDYSPAQGELAGAWASSLPACSLEAWVLSEFDRLSASVIGSYNRYDFQGAYKALYDFCNDTLSATYLAAVKDRLYCDAPDSVRRRRTQAALFMLTDGLCRLLAPVLCHTADEAWRCLHRCAPDDNRCVHLETFLPPTGARADPRWPLVHAVLGAARVALEKAKSALGVENPLDAGLTLPDPRGELRPFDPVDLADLLGVSEVVLDGNTTDPIVRDLRDRPRCERSWKRDGTVRQRSDGGMLSDRDAQALGLA